MLLLLFNIINMIIIINIITIIILIIINYFIIIQYSLFLHGNLILIIFYCLDNGYVFENHIGIVFQLIIPSHHHYFTIKKLPPILIHYHIYIYNHQITITTQSNHPNPSQITRI